MFEDVKVGDIVLTKITIQLSFWGNSGKSYMVRSVVDKVTPKRFTTRDQTYKKVNGHNIKYGSSAKVLCPEEDQTDAAKSYKKEVDLRWKLSNMLDKFNTNEADLSVVTSMVALMEEK